MILTIDKIVKSLNSTYYLPALILATLIACQPAVDQTSNAGEAATMEVNPPAEGFDAENSDPKAIEVADQVMEAMGGRKAWDQTRYLSWNFFGARHLVWDKHQGLVRIEYPDSSLYLVDVNQTTGRVAKKGEELTIADSLQKELQKAERVWINDSYWLVMPFKLKDSGVTLKYQGLGQSEDGTPSHILKLTFKEVGVTPQNMYLVYVDTASNLVNQWAFYRTADQDSANFVRPWGNYQKHGEILLSDYRGERNLSEVHVYDSLPSEIFTSIEEVDLTKYQ